MAPSVKNILRILALLLWATMLLTLGYFSWSIFALVDQAKHWQIFNQDQVPQATFDKNGRIIGPSVYISTRPPDLEYRIEHIRLKDNSFELGEDLKKLASARHQLWRGQRKVFDVEYHTDRFGRRISSPQTNNDRNSHFLSFFGCSMIFGNGINDEQTLPAQMQKLNPKLAVYNYALPGAGPNHALALLQSRDIRAQIPQRRGTGIFTLIDDHIPRAIGNSFWMLATPLLPRYILKDHKAIRAGNYLQDRPWTSALYRFLNTAPWIKDLKIILPLHISDQDHELVCAILEEMKNNFSRQFTGSDFYVFLYPGMSPEYRLRYKTCLADRGVNSIDVHSDFWKGTLQSKTVDEVDQHPSAAYNESLAKVLHTSLGY